MPTRLFRDSYSTVEQRVKAKYEGSRVALVAYALQYLQSLETCKVNFQVCTLHKNGTVEKVHLRGSGTMMPQIAWEW
jgi:hypothetical protein